MSDPTVPRWTPETEALAVRAIVDAIADHDGETRLTDEEWATTDSDEVAAAEEMRAIVRPALAVLADAGLLVTPEMTALRVAAHEWRTTGAAGGFDHLAASLHLLAAVDALEADRG